MAPNQRFLNLSSFFWALLALGLAVLWVFVGPHSRLTDDGSLRYAVIRWGHAATWLLLAASFFLRGFSSGPKGVANGLGLAAALVYALFIIMAFVAK
jgi:hypothetical protein